MRGGVSRRGFLRLSALGAAVAASARGDVARAGQAAPQDDYLENGRFRVDIPGATSSSKLCVSASVDPIRVKIDDVRSGDHRVLRPAWTSFGEARFTFRIPQSGVNADLHQWMKEATAASFAPRKNITITLLDRHGAPARTWTLMDCFPTKFDLGDYASDSPAAVAELRVHVGRMELA